MSDEIKDIIRGLREKRGVAWAKEGADELTRLAKENKKLKAVVDAARRYVGGGEYHERLEARNDLEDAIRAMDGEE